MMMRPFQNCYKRYVFLSDCELKVYYAVAQGDHGYCLGFVLRVTFINSCTFLGHHDGSWKDYVVLVMEYILRLLSIPSQEYKIVKVKL